MDELEEDDVVDDVVEDKEIETEDPKTDVDFLSEDASDDDEDVTEEKEEKEEEKDKYDEEDKNLKVGHVNFADLKKEFPDVLKKYPELRDVVYRDRAFTETFGTVGEAKEAAEKIQVMDFFDRELSNGNPGVLVQALEGNALSAFADNILPALHAKSPDLFVKATEPVLLRILNSAYQQGTNSKDDNLAAAAQVLHKFLFNDYKIKPVAGVKRDAALEQQRMQLEQERQYDFQSLKSHASREFDENASSRLERMISKDLDADESLTPLMKKYITEQAVQQIDNKLSQDTYHMSNMKALWKSIEKSRYNRTGISQAVAAYLGRAQRLVGPIRARLKAEALGKKPASVTAKRVSGGETVSKGKRDIDPKKIKWRDYKNDTDFLSRD